MINGPNRKSRLTKKVALFALVCVLMLIGCGRPTSVSIVGFNHNAPAKKLSDGRYEVKLSYRIAIRRYLFKWPLLQFPLLSHVITYNNTNWLYVACTNGTVDATNVLVTTGLSNKDFATIKGMTGTICFSNGMMTINLNHGPGYMPFYLNGTYQLE